jgi:hypothetical protein
MATTTSIPPQAPGPLNPIQKQSVNAGAVNTAAVDALLAVIVQTGGIAIVVIIAGFNDTVANLMIVFIVGLWILFLVMHPDIVGKYSNVLTNIQTGAKKA